VYSRADLSRTVLLVVTLSLTAAATGAIAREFRAADTQSEDYPTVQALRHMGRAIAERSNGRHQMSEMIRSLGADPVELPYGQVLTGLATKLIDGAGNNWPSFVTTDHCKYAGFYTLTEHTMSPEVLVMPENAWETLSAEDRKIFREAARRFGQFMREKWRDLEDQSHKRAETAGATIVTDFDRKPFEQAMTGIYATTQLDPAAAQLIERIRKVE
jgi:TRAP-type C4-dicarboxylate transport system substrate-binding protein